MSWLGAYLYVLTGTLPDMSTLPGHFRDFRLDVAKRFCCTHGHQSSSQPGFACAWAAERSVQGCREGAARFGAVHGKTRDMVRLPDVIEGAPR